MCSKRAVAIILTLALTAGVSFAEEEGDALFARYAKSYALMDGKYEKIPDELKAKYDTIYMSTCAVGQAGTVGDECSVFQVLGPTSMLVLAKYPGIKSSVFMVKNYSTKGMADEVPVTLPRMIFIGTTTYKTITGSRTAFLAIPVREIGLNKEQFAALLKKPEALSELRSRLKVDRETEATQKLQREERVAAEKEAAELLKQAKTEENALAKEKLANAHLKYATKLIANSEEEKGKKRLRALVAEFPGTKAAMEAAKRLKEMGEKP